MTEEFDFNKLPIFCLHFNGLKFGDKTKKCNAGVIYEEIANKPNEDWPFYKWPYCYPCIRGSTVNCQYKTFSKKEFTGW